LGRWWRKEPAAEKTRNAIGSKQLREDGGFKGHGEASAHPLVCSVENERERAIGGKLLGVAPMVR
jgi:hypothetical protein